MLDYLCQTDATDDQEQETNPMNKPIEKVSVSQLKVGDVVHVSYGVGGPQGSGTVFFVGKGYTSIRTPHGGTLRVKCSAKIYRETK